MLVALDEFAGDGPVLLPRCARDNSHMILLSRDTGALMVLQPDATPTATLTPAIPTPLTASTSP